MKTPEQSWPASKVALWPIEKIRPYEKNPRLHSEAQIELIASSMRDDGVTAPILVDEAGVVIYGHGRRLAALKNGYTKYPVVVAVGWSEQKKRAVRIKDNSFGVLSTWGFDLLRSELQDLKLEGYDMPLLGFDLTTVSWMTSGDLVADGAGEWNGMPQFSQEDQTAFRSIVVHFKDQKSVDQFAKATKQKIGEKTRFLWYPNIEIKPFVKVISK